MADLPPDISAGLREESNKRAAADPLPGPLADAFLKGAIPWGDGRFVRRVVASDWKILKALDSPIFRQMLEAQKKPELREETVYSDEDQWEMCWQFTHTPAENRALIAKGREAYRAAAETWADETDLTDMAFIVDSITKLLVSSSNTRVGFGSSAEKKTA